MDIEFSQCEPLLLSYFIKVLDYLHRYTTLQDVIYFII